MDQKQDGKCPHCGANMKEFWHPLTPGLVQILLKCIKAVKKNGVNRFHWEQDMQYSRSESHNFNKLRYHGLIAHADPDSKRSGYWLITDRGGKFLRGEIYVPKRVKTFRNKVILHDEEKVQIRQLLTETPWFAQDYDFEIHEGKYIPNFNRQQVLI